jgi:hypothetical protein
MLQQIKTLVEEVETLIEHEPSAAPLVETHGGEHVGNGS